MKQRIVHGLFLPVFWLSVSHLDTAVQPVAGTDGTSAVTMRFEVQKPTPCTTLAIHRDPVRQHHYVLQADPGRSPCIQVIATDTITVRDTIHTTDSVVYTLRWNGDSIVVKVGV